MGLVTQDSILFNDTIKANIALGKLTIQMTKLLKRHKMYNAYEFVKDLPKEYIPILEIAEINFQVGKKATFDY
jgi:ABC-type bacteriocin/lantibiotic exporter with double-glycine peptidase domain